MARTSFDKNSEYIMKNINGAQVAQILAIDTEKETLTVKLYNRDLIYDNGVPKAGRDIELSGVPFFVYSGGVASIEMPISTGDDCLIVFCDYNYNRWMKTQQSDIDTNSPHSRNYPVALVGLRSSQLVNGDFSVTDIVVRNGSNENPEIVKLIMSPTNIEATAENIIITSTMGPVTISSQSTVNISSVDGGTTLVAGLEQVLLAVRDGVDTRGDSFNGSTKAAIDAGIAEIKKVIG